MNNWTFEGPHGPIRGNTHEVPKGTELKGVLVFAHGYKGFKDWGAWSLMGEFFASHGFRLLRFNFSHNGHVPPNEMDCSDLEAWSLNNLSIEKEDLLSVLNYAKESKVPLYVMGHSRGGGITSLASASPKSNVDGVILLASLCDFGARFPKGEALEKWRKTDRAEIVNARTGQTLYHSFSFYQDFEDNSESLNIEKALRSLSVPLLSIHGDSDEVVFIGEGRKLAKWAEKGEFYSVNGAGHTFDMMHPWESNELPKCASDAFNKTIEFLNRIV